MVDQLTNKIEEMRLGNFWFLETKLGGKGAYNEKLNDLICQVNWESFQVVFDQEYNDFVKAEASALNHSLRRSFLHLRQHRVNEQGK